MGFQLDFNCGASQGALNVVFRYPAEAYAKDNEVIDGLIKATWHNLHVEQRFHCVGWDLNQFALSFRQVHKELTGVATFTNGWDNEIRFRPNADGRGTVEVDLVLEIFSNDEVRRSKVELPGFHTDQSYLLSTASEIDRFLGETGVNLQHPFSR